MDSNKIYYTTQGNSHEIIVFLHGLWGGGNYFRDLNFLELPDYTLYFPDELGFGKSPKPPINYSVELHCKKIKEILPKNKKVILIGNSFGSNLCFHFAREYPSLVKKIVLISPVIHNNNSEAKKYLSSRFIPYLTIFFPYIAHVICLAVCKTRLLSYISSLWPNKKYQSFLKKSTEHTWHSYYSTFINGFFENPLSTRDLTTLANHIPTLVIYGKNDNYSNTEIIKSLKAPKLTIYSIDKGNHNILFEYSKYKEIISKWL